MAFSASPSGSVARGVWRHTSQRNGHPFSNEGQNPAYRPSDTLKTVIPASERCAATRSASRGPTLWYILPKIGGLMTSKTTLTGAAGEYFVMSELLKRGYVAALAPVGVPKADIVVTDEDGNKQAAIQVKSRRYAGGDGGWHMSKKHEDIIGDHLLYCFVNFRDQATDVFVIPSAVVASVVREAHAKWLATPGKNGRVRNDSNMRRITPSYNSIFQGGANPYPDGWMDRYRDAWKEYLGVPQRDPDHETV